MYVRTGFVKAWNEKEDLKGKLEIKVCLVQYSGSFISWR